MREEWIVAGCKSPITDAEDNEDREHPPPAVDAPDSMFRGLPFGLSPFGDYGFLEFWVEKDLRGISPVPGAPVATATSPGYDVNRRRNICPSGDD